MKSVVGELRSELALAVLMEKKQNGKVNQQQAADLIKNIQLVLDAMMEKDKKDKEKILTLSKNQPM
ncbi:MAG: hypothetical protein D6687_11315 [Acidobacteria bacterium]|jgi:hypothetical protein|nr:MAG: hypothetical protein D6687_11315 [Acidobacteriota bacterium]GIU83073.1 MAG: hypothetical protein KatS3mg006_2137 [Pyrinomonadaceae bacterium]